MQRHHSSINSAVALITATCLVLPPFVDAFGAQGAATPAPAKPAAVAAPPTIDGGWPKSFATSSGGVLVFYQPQTSSWEAQKHLVAYAAVAYTEKGAEKPALGTVKIESATRASPWTSVSSALRSSRSPR